MSLLKAIAGLGAMLLSVGIVACGQAVSEGTDGQSHWVTCLSDNDCDLTRECRQQICQYPSDSRAERDAGTDPDPDCADGGASCADATEATCGDGELAEGELCDDGNQTSGDGCSLDCQVEAGFTCLTPGQLCMADAAR